MSDAEGEVDVEQERFSENEEEADAEEEVDHDPVDSNDGRVEDQSDEDGNLDDSKQSHVDESVDEATLQAQSDAAVKIQAIQRGIRDRLNVRDMKAKGNLPSQQRATKRKPVIVRESAISHGEVTFYDGIGSHYVGELMDGLPHGKGRYTFVNGTVYEGGFVAGQFEGKGHYIFEGIGKVEANFVDGRAVGESLTFDDGLQYQPQGWKYCVEGDRRFYHEVVDPRFGLTD
jgi:hypothetical protein